MGANAVVPLPDGVVGDIYGQWLYTDPSARGGARVSQAAQIRVR